MKYTKPGITREKFSLLPLAITPEVASLPITEENDPTYEPDDNGAGTLSSAFGEVFDFSNK